MTHPTPTPLGLVERGNLTTKHTKHETRTRSKNQTQLDSQVRQTDQLVGLGVGLECSDGVLNSGEEASTGSEERVDFAAQLARVFVGADVIKVLDELLAVLLEASRTRRLTAQTWPNKQASQETDDKNKNKKQARTKPTFEGLLLACVGGGGHLLASCFDGLQLDGASAGRDIGGVVALVADDEAQHEEQRKERGTSTDRNLKHREAGGNSQLCKTNKTLIETSVEEISGY